MLLTLSYNSLLRRPVPEERLGLSQSCLFSCVVIPTARKKGRVLARKRALLMHEIHPKVHFCSNRLSKCELDKGFYVF